MIALPMFRGCLSGVDPDTALYRTASGATDTVVIDQLVKYLKSQSLWTSCRLFPFKSAQNKGSGTTVYGIGGWTSNNVSLINGPVWGADGVAFDAVDDRATWDGTGITSLAELYTFDVQKPVGASLADTQRFGLLSMGDNGAGRAIFCGHSTAVIAGETTSIGLTLPGPAYRKAGTSKFLWSANEKVQMVNRLAASGSGTYKSKAPIDLDILFGTQDFAPSSMGGSINSILNINCYYNSPSYLVPTATTRVALLLCKSSLTTAQRETITDYLDLL